MLSIEAVLYNNFIAEQKHVHLFILRFARLRDLWVGLSGTTGVPVGIKHQFMTPSLGLQQSNKTSQKILVALLISAISSSHKNS